MGDAVQTGLVAAVAVEDYENGAVMKHELTRKEKEQDRIRHFDVCNCHTEPVFLTYRHTDEIDSIFPGGSKTMNRFIILSVKTKSAINFGLWMMIKS